MYLTRMEPGAGAARYYRIELVPGLFGDWAMIREWGRVGRAAQSRTDWFDTEAEAKDARFTLQMQKSKSGYE